MSQTAINVRVEEFTRFDFLTYEEGRGFAVIRQWPTMMNENWHIDAPGSWVGSFLSTIMEEGWEPQSFQDREVGWFWWKRTVRTWLFIKRIPCRKVFYAQGPGSVTSRLRDTQDLPEWGC